MITLRKRLRRHLSSLAEKIEKFWFFRDEDYLVFDVADQLVSTFQPRNWEEVWVAFRVARVLILILPFILLGVDYFYHKLIVLDYFYDQLQ